MIKESDSPKNAFVFFQKQTEDSHFFELHSFV